MEIICAHGLKSLTEPPTPVWLGRHRREARDPERDTEVTTRTGGLGEASDLVGEDKERKIGPQEPSLNS